MGARGQCKQLAHASFDLPPSQKEKSDEDSRARPVMAAASLAGAVAERQDTIYEVRVERLDTLQDLVEQRVDTVREVREQRRQTAWD